MNDDPLGSTRRTTRVHDASNVLSVGPPALIDRFTLAKLPYLFNLQHLDSWTSGFDRVESTRGRITIMYDELDRGCVRNDSRKCGQKIRVGEHTDTIWLLE